MSNPTTYRYPKKIVDNLDGTVTEVEKSIRRNRDKNVIVKVKNSEGHTLVVYHLVYDSKGRVVHGPHEEPDSRDPNYKGEFPLINLFE